MKIEIIGRNVCGKRIKECKIELSQDDYKEYRHNCMSVMKDEAKKELGDEVFVFAVPLWKPTESKYIFRLEIYRDLKDDKENIRDNGASSEQTEQRLQPQKSTDTKNKKRNNKNIKRGKS